MSEQHPWGCEAVLLWSEGRCLQLCFTTLPPKADRKPGGYNACDHADPQRNKDATYSDLNAQHKPQQMANCHHCQEER